MNRYYSRVMIKMTLVCIVHDVKFTGEVKLKVKIRIEDSCFNKQFGNRTLKNVLKK